MKMSKLALAKKQIKEMTRRGVKVRFVSCGKVLIDGLPFSFSVASGGEPSQKGVVVSFSGEPVENGTLTLGTIEMRYSRSGRAHSETKKLVRIEKSDGKHIYQAKFPSASLEDYQPTGKKADSEMFLADITSAYTFKVTPTFKEPKDAEVMVTVYPIADPLAGLAVEWRDCTSDKDWFEHNPDAFRQTSKRKSK
ncbi:MAG: hypothetical protein IKN17_01535 [Ruminococcus sp.]|nr:hypothetical protein [Ruminococcus sp.]